MLHYLVTALVLQYALDTIIGVIVFYRAGLIDSGPLRAQSDRYIFLSFC